MRCLAALAFALVPAVTFAQAMGDYTTEELVAFYVKSIDLGKNRGICIGSAEECAAPAAAEPPALDMKVNFELDSTELTAEAEQNLAVFAAMMQDRRLKIADFVVEGYTDARGADQYNDALSLERAEAVRAYLIGLGVEPDRLSSVGFGKSRPRVDDPMDPENRRVELRIDLN